ncbi:MAG: dipeptidase [Cyclobacteriaceae bacterium]|nr:membrane dipeptidase [Cyclobacteriaceae bacterium]MCH8515781.1 dipeptidase [Cyclobacteriaceae bacterium]
MKRPIIDLHCDLPAYMYHVKGADPANGMDMGATLHFLLQGEVSIQTMAIYTDTKAGSVSDAINQAIKIKELTLDFPDYFHLVKTKAQFISSAHTKQVGILTAIENASGLLEEHEPLEQLEERIKAIKKYVGRIFYIGITHHKENRFGGGNMTQVGLKSDGEYLLDTLNGKRIAIDLSHTSDALAYGILNYIDSKGLDIPIIASHSNFREVFDHPRNLPNDLALEVMKRSGLVGINFLRAYLADNEPELIYEHIQKGIALGLEKQLAFGADFFYTQDHPHYHQRVPFYFPEHENASTYPSIAKGISENTPLSNEQVNRIAYQNVIEFVERVWEE